MVHNARISRFVEFINEIIFSIIFKIKVPLLLFTTIGSKVGSYKQLINSWNFPLDVIESIMFYNQEDRAN